MEELAAGSLDTMISGANKAVLADIVKLVQKQGMKGSFGGWKEFLKSYDRKVGAALSDPLRRSLDVLVAFLKSFNHTKDLMVYEEFSNIAQKNGLVILSCLFFCFQLIEKLLRHYTDHRAIEKHFMESMEESPVQRLVRLTMEHPRYTKHYAFPSYDKDWIVLPLGDISNAMKSKSMVSVDCEMVLCQDGTEEVVKVCIVDKKLKVKLENLVNPNKGIADYRTEITGVSSEDLVGVNCSLVDIQESMKKLLKNGTVLVGHSLHNDMRALKIEYNCVIDTSYIFRCLGMPPTYTPSLNNLCKAVLGYEFRKEGEPHDCRMDAEVAMKLVLAKLENGIDDPFKIVQRVSDSERAKLLLHRIPVETPCQELRKVFPHDFTFDVQTDLKVRGPFYSTYVVFKDACEADKAFQGIEGRKKKDIEGRLQKCVHLKLSTGKGISFNIRKMAIYLPPEDSNSALTKICYGDASRNSKRQRTLSSTTLMKKRSPKFREPPTWP